MKVYDSIIIGSGPAGLTAAIYLGRARRATLLIEDAAIPAQALYAQKIDNYPGFPDGISGVELITRLKKQAAGFGAEIYSTCAESLAFDKDKRSWRVSGKDVPFEAISVIVASGSRPRPLGVKGEADFLGKGVSYCAVCDGAFFKGKDVVVVGRGAKALEEAGFLSKFASKVYFITEAKEQDPAYQNPKANNNIEFSYDTKIIEIRGDKGVNSITVSAAGMQRQVSCGGVFIFAGFVPSTGFLKGVLGLNEKGYIVTNERMETQAAGLFACGDCRNKDLRQVITACSDGAIAANFCNQYIAKIKSADYNI